MNAKITRSKIGQYLFAFLTIAALLLSACSPSGTPPAAVEITRIVREVVTATPKPTEVPDLAATARYEATEIVSAAQTQAAPAATEVQAAAATEAPEATVEPTQGEYNLTEDFQRFLNVRGGTMAALANEGDATVVYDETVSGLAGFAVFGAPAKVDPNVVLRAQGADAYGNVFTNTVGLGTEMMLAEPGSILYGPDENPDIVTNNPHGAYISPITQALLESDSARINVQEGGFVWCTGREMTVELPSVGVRLDGADGHNWFLMIRGLFEDGKQDSDLNQTLVFQDYVAGHTQCMMYPPGAYVSEGNFLQVAELSHTGGTNCGREGCSGLSVLMLDLNTGAWNVVHQSQTKATWEAVDSNWR